ncbi:hypothetical protein EKO27_g1276 [Xylaria grammica]|uniref:Arginosuccinase n=1 Tax=Xylaria grammica TaxID=363999 RepID=A0A439DHI3_9PEZI|nr:hypothetical protein EKO27_g1276 [Xylaria grammica]
MASEKAPAENMLWGGRFTGRYPRQHCLCPRNAKSGIISNDEFAEIERGLREVQKEWEADTFIIMPNDEDIHTANERRLGEIIGKDTAGKLHTGRSRNEQVVYDMRMWLRDQIREIESQLVAFIEVIAACAEAKVGIIMPGYTHLQRAMVVMWSQNLLSFDFNFSSDLERLRGTLKRVNRSPLGCGALAGNSFNIDRDMMAEELGFKGLLRNSMNAVADRDFVTEFLQWGSMFMQHISRWAEDLILYSSTEFSFVSIADAYSTRSSLMPQKKNPDGLGPRKAYPTISDSVQIANGVLTTLTIRPDRMRAALDPFMLATDLADYLVRKGVPFRERHHISGRCVVKSEEPGVPMNELSLKQLQAIDSRFVEDVLDTFNYETSVEMRSAKGGTSRACVLEQVKVLKAIYNYAFWGWRDEQDTDQYNVDSQSAEAQDQEMSDVDEVDQDTGDPNHTGGVSVPAPAQDSPQSPDQQQGTYYTYHFIFTLESTNLGEGIPNPSHLQLLATYPLMYFIQYGAYTVESEKESIPQGFANLGRYLNKIDLFQDTTIM